MCDFDVQSLKCGDQPAPSCLIEEELTAVRTIYEDFYVDGALVYPGYPPGAELYPGGWSRWLTGGAEASGNFQSGIEVPPDLPVPSGPNFHFSFGNGVMKYLVFHDPDWDVLIVHNSIHIPNAPPLLPTYRIRNRSRDWDVAFERDGTERWVYKDWTKVPGERR